ncbi:MAG TPA: hypothetical protein VF316_05270 [Polyangiaceae bacterium]
MGLEPPSTPNDRPENNPVRDESLPAFLGPIAGTGGEKSDAAGVTEAQLEAACTRAFLAGNDAMAETLRAALARRQAERAGNVVQLKKSRGQK